ncbi:ABC transporter substrate-binding protein [Candidatus Falkowbacteria bacterium]|nr:ABC transporter substrate-binding protein [Candidatus Falkowbacteria bacterium]
MKKITIAIVAIIVVGLIAYFGLKLNKPTQTTINSEPIKVGIAVYPGFGTFYVAQEKEFFKKQGVNVEMVQLSLDAMVPALEGNQVQMLVGSTDMMPIIADAGIAAKQIFSTSISYGADGLVTTKDIQKISDLKGKKVYAAYGFPGHFFFRYFAGKSGLSNKDVELINLNSEEVGSSFVAGKINAGMTWEPWLSKASERADGKVLVSSKDEPGIITDIVLARNDLVQNRREDVKRVMKGFFEAIEWWKKNSVEGNTIVARNFNLTVEEFAPMMEVIKLSDLQTNLDKFNKSKPLNVYELAEKAADVYLQDEVIKTKATGDVVTDSSLLNEIR